MSIRKYVSRVTTYVRTRVGKRHLVRTRNQKKAFSMHKAFGGGRVRRVRRSRSPIGGYGGY